MRGRQVPGLPTGLSGLGTPTDGDVLVGSGGHYTGVHNGTATRAATQRALDKLARGDQDFHILYISDSTADATDEWSRLTSNGLAARYPAMTAYWHQWDPSGGASYLAQSGIQTGNVGSPKVLHFWNCTKAGVGTSYTRGSRWAAAVQAINAPNGPDLIIIALGKNEGASASGYTAAHWMSQMLALTTSLAAEHRHAGIVIVTQNPNIADGDMSLKATAYAEVADFGEYGFVDVHQAFVDTGNVAGYTRADGIHPTAANDVPPPTLNGSVLWANTLLNALLPSVVRDTHATQASSLTPGEQLLRNGDFVAFSGSTPAGWSASGATAAKDTRAGWSESREYGCRIQASGAAPSYLYQDISDVARFAGKEVTFLVRERIPAAGLSTAGVVAIVDSVGTTQSFGPLEARDGFLWHHITRKVDSAATTLQVRIYADTANTAGADITIDSAYLTFGVLPKTPRVAQRDDFTPMDHGIKAWAFDPIAATAASALAVAGTLYTTLLHLPQATTITNILAGVQTAGATLTAGQCFAAIFQASTGALLGTTADQSAAWVSAGMKTMAISGGPITVPAGDVIVAFWFNGTTGPALIRGNGVATASNAFGNVGLANVTARFGTADTGKTTTAPATLGARSLSTFSFWAGLS